MAITNITQPTRWQRRRGRIIFSFLSNQLAQPNFRYIIQVVQGNGTTPFATYLIQPNSAGWVHFDVSSAIGDRVEIDAKNPDYNNIVHELPSAPNFIFSKSNKGFSRFRVRCAEYYGTPPATPAASFTSFYDVAVIDGVKPIALGQAYNLYDDFGTVALPSKFWLTDRPTNSDNEIIIEAGEDDRGAMAFINNIWGTLGFGDLHALEYELYNGATLLANNTISISTTTGTQLPTNNAYASGKLTYMGVLPSNLSDADSPLPVGAQPALLPWTHYIIYPVDTVGGRVGDILRINNTAPPCKHDSVMLAWANTVGGWDLYRMDGRAEIREAAKGKQYQQHIGSYNAATYAYNTFDRGDKEYFIKREVTYVLNSGYVREEDAKLLSGVVHSTNVMIKHDGQWKPVTVRRRPISHGSNISKLRNISIEVVFSQREP